jgi:hypothetical protein
MIWQDVKHSTDITALVGEFIPLNKHGYGLCPFHADTKPSFHVKKQHFRCFSCGEYGDVFDFVQKFHKMTKADSLRYLAHRAGIDIDEKVEDLAHKIEINQKKRDLEKVYKWWRFREQIITAGWLCEYDRWIEKISPSTLHRGASKALVDRRTHLEYIDEILKDDVISRELFNNEFAI